MSHHSEAWKEALETDERGVGQFQEQLFRAVLDLADDLGRTPHWILRDYGEVARSRGYGPTYEGVFLAHRTKFWIDRDSFHINGPNADARIEHWDATTPEEARKRFLERLSLNLTGEPQLLAPPERFNAAVVLRAVYKHDPQPLGQGYASRIDAVERVRLSRDEVERAVTHLERQGLLSTDREGLRLTDLARAVIPGATDQGMESWEAAV